MFNDNVDLLAEATGYSEALNNSFLEQYTSLDDMVHEMICESYEDMLRFSHFEHDADMMEAKMIVQQESVQSITAFQEGIFKKAKNFAKKIIDKIKIKWRKFCIWVNRKIGTFLAKRVAGMKEKADKAFDNIDGDKPTVKYFTKLTSGSKTGLSDINTKFTEIANKIKPAPSSTGSLVDTHGELNKNYYKSTSSVSRERALSMRKDFEENVLGDLESTEIRKNMWDITKSDVKDNLSQFIKKGDATINSYIKDVEKLVRDTKSVASNDKKNREKDQNAATSNANVNLAINSFNSMVSLASAAMSCYRKVCWAALKAAAKARMSGGSDETTDYKDSEETEGKYKGLITGKEQPENSSSKYFDDIDLSVF